MTTAAPGQRVIGIRHSLRLFKNAGLIHESVMHPADAVKSLVQKTRRSKSAVRFRQARSDSSIQALASTVEKKFGLPKGCIRVIYSNGRAAPLDATVGDLRKCWS